MTKLPDTEREWHGPVYLILGVMVAVCILILFGFGYHLLGAALYD